MRERIAIFGGSFNPIHRGHIGLAERAADEHGLAKVLVTPAHVSPFKTGGPPSLPDEVRWRLVEIACAGHPRLEPWRFDLDRGGVSYAIDTVRAARAAHPGADVYFIVGEDSVAELPRWKDWETLRTLCTFVSFPRTPESSTEIRRRLAAGESADDMLDPRVAAELRKLQAGEGR